MFPVPSCWVVAAEAQAPEPQHQQRRVLAVQRAEERPTLSASTCSVSMRSMKLGEYG